MRKFIPILIALLLTLFLISQAEAVMFISGTSAAGGGGACNTIAQSETDTSAATMNIGQYGSRLYAASEFVATSSFDLCGVNFYLSEVGDATGKTMTARIYSDTGPSVSPSTELGASAGVDASNAPATEGTVNFSFSSAVSLTSGTTYWIGLYAGTASADYINIHEETSGATEHVVRSDDGSTWVDWATNLTLKYELLK